MNQNRIYFKGNPWPEGHPIKRFELSSRIEDDGYVWIDITLESENYYSERDIDDDEDDDYESDWSAPIVWGNYHRCTISSTKWGNSGVKLCKVDEYCLSYLDGLELSVDPKPEEVDDWEELAFHIYLLGHDAVAKHKIKFNVDETRSKINIDWVGKIAQAYIGSYDFDRDFSICISDVDFPVPVILEK